MHPTVTGVAIGFTGLAVGFVIAGCYFRLTRKNEQAADPAEPQPRTVDENDVARMDMAAQQLREFTIALATDVAGHNRLVGSVSLELESLQQDGAASGGVLKGAIAKLLQANNTLQTRLEEAERRIEAQAAEIQMQQSEARTDALTGLANRRAFDAYLHKCSQRLRECQTPFSLVLLDIDHFKQLNDALGHVAGDEVLRSIGRVLKCGVRSDDLSCRYGGEEFAVILPGMTLPQAQRAAEQLRRTIEELNVEFNGETLRVTASFGIAQAASDQSDLELVRRADEAVYAAKRAGRNATYWHDGESTQSVGEANRSDVTSPASPRKAPGRSGVVTEAARSMPDRRAFAAALTRGLAESRRFGTPLSVLHLAVTDFRKVFREYDDADQAAALVSVGDVIASTIREMDLVGRLEEGRFVVMLPRTSHSAAAIVGQRVKTKIASHVISQGARYLRLQVDIGIAVAEAYDSAETAMSRAQQALRNRAASSSETTAAAALS